MVLRLACLIAFGCAACDGGPSGEVDVVSASCRATATGIVIDGEYDAALALDEAIEIDVAIDGSYSSTVIEDWVCAGWTTTLSGEFEHGCQRDQETQPEQQIVRHQRIQTFDEPTLHVVITPIVVVNNGGHPAGDGLSLDCTP